MSQYGNRKKKRVNPARLTAFLLVLAAVACVAAWGAGGLMRSASERRDGPPSGASGDAPADPNARFSVLYFYEEARHARYLSYESAHPGLSPDEVVWRVNVDVDKPFYEDAVEIADADSEQALVNKHFKLPDDFEPAELVDVDGDYRVTPATKDAYERMRADAADAGFSIRATSAYRSIEYQKGLYARYLDEDPGNADNYSARPGFSEHHTGRTIDLVGPSGTLRGFAGTDEAAWVRENAWKYGFIVRYTVENEDVTGYESEPWHVTYIGKEAAALMRGNDVGSLEEYVAKYVRREPPRR
jgi:D-alanyl-D-alanine carboxypeptidase